jgi:putative toxin-antitoxin system antitoxin component (TIGR02293 family)
MVMNVGATYKPKTSVRNTVSLLAVLSLPKQPVEAHVKILAGFSSDIVAKLSSETNIDELVLCQWVGISRANYHRKNKEDKKILSVEHSGKIYLIIKVLDAARSLFDGDMSVVITWLNSPARALGGACPLQMLSTPTGTEAVLDLIGRIEHGVIS